MLVVFSIILESGGRRSSEHGIPQSGGRLKKLITWAEFAFAQENKTRKTHCDACLAGQDGVTCMRDTNPEGFCPYADRHPILDESNALALDIFYLVQGTAETISAKNKDFKYVRPTELQALMDIYEVLQEDRANMVEKIYSLQDIDNKYRPNRRKPKSR